MKLKNKADVLQGLTGIYMIAIFLFGMLFTGITTAISTSEPIYFLKTMFFWIIPPILLGSLTLWLRENKGFDIFGFLTILISIIYGLYIFFKGTGAITLLPFNMALVIAFFYPIVGVGLLLEAFDKIKPLK